MSRFLTFLGWLLHQALSSRQGLVSNLVTWDGPDFAAAKWISHPPVFGTQSTNSIIMFDASQCVVEAGAYPTFASHTVQLGQCKDTLHKKAGVTQVIGQRTGPRIEGMTLAILALRAVMFFEQNAACKSHRQAQEPKQQRQKAWSIPQPHGRRSRRSRQPGVRWVPGWENHKDKVRVTVKIGLLNPAYDVRQLAAFARVAIPL